ncbi:MAG: DUF4340 domain-containing protein, partial [Bryobacteraceae bacterium]
MPVRGLLAASVVLALLAGAVYWSERQRKAAEGKPDPDAPPKLITLAEDQVQEIRIEKQAAEPTVIGKDKSDEWRITAPKPLPVDDSAAGSVVSSLSGLTWDRLVEEKAPDLSPYGLDQPAVEITVTRKDQQASKLLIGDETPTSGAFYAKLANDPRVFTITGSTKDSLDKTAQDLRDKRLLRFDSDKLVRVELNAKGQAIEFGKNAAGEWQIVKPSPMRADNFQVEELVRRLSDARIDASSGAFTGSRVATATVTDNAGTHRIEVRKKGEDYLARSSDVEGIHKVTSDFGQGVDKALNDFRNRKLFDFGFNEPGKIQVRDGDKTYAFEKSGEQWMSAGKKMDATSVQALIDKLRDLSAAGFVSEGFTTPVLELTVTRDQGKRVEKVLV